MTAILYIGNQLNSNTKNPTYNVTLGRLLEQEGFRVFNASSKKNKFIRLLDMLYSCFKYRKKVDYVLIDTYSTLNFYYAFCVSQFCRLLRLRYITLLHGGGLPNRLKNNPVMCRLIFNKAYKNIAPSLYLKACFKDFGYDQVMHIPNALTLSDYPYTSRTCDKVRLLWVRSFSKIYNPQLAVKVLKALQDDGTNASLCMVGPDSDGSLEDVKALANALDVTVTFTGKLSKAEWTKLSEAYTVFINTTDFDNMPISVLEAMALGLPVITTNVGGMPYLIDHKKDGLLVAPNSLEDFVYHIKWIAKNHEGYNAITKHARMKVETYDWEVVKKQWLDVFNNVSST